MTDVFKGLVHPKMKISPYFTLGVYDFLLSDESNRSYTKNFLALCKGFEKKNVGGFQYKPRLETGFPSEK